MCLGDQFWTGALKVKGNFSDPQSCSPVLMRSRAPLAGERKKTSPGRQGFQTLIIRFIPPVNSKFFPLQNVNALTPLWMQKTVWSHPARLWGKPRNTWSFLALTFSPTSFISFIFCLTFIVPIVHYKNIHRKAKQFLNMISQFLDKLLIFKDLRLIFSDNSVFFFFTPGVKP